MNTLNIDPGTKVLYKNKLYKLVSVDLGGKCKIKKMDLPFKGRVLLNIDISELTIYKP